MELSVCSNEGERRGIRPIIYIHCAALTLETVFQVSFLDGWDSTE